MPLTYTHRHGAAEWALTWADADQHGVASCICGFVRYYQPVSRDMLLGLTNA